MRVKMKFMTDWWLIILLSVTVLTSVSADADTTTSDSKDQDWCDEGSVDPLMPEGYNQNCKTPKKPKSFDEMLPPENESGPSESELHNLEDPVTSAKPAPEWENASNKSENVEHLKSNYQYCHRFLKAIQYHLKSKGLSAGSYIRLNIDADDLDTLLKLELCSDDEYKCPISDAFDILTEGIHYVEMDNSDSSEKTWISPYQQSFLSVVFQVTAIVFMVLNILYIMLALWRRLGWKRFSLFMMVAVFWISVPWTYIHLYKQNLAERIGRQNHGITDRDCQPSNIPWYDLFLRTYARKCETFYQDIIIDPLWEVKPTQAVAVTFIEFVWSPLAVMGEPLGKFIQGVLDPLPFFMKPIVGILGLCFLGFVITINSGIRIWTWFFTLEPANLAQNQLTAMNDTIENMRQLVQAAGGAQQQRDNEVNELLTRLDRQLTQHDDLNEMLPVLDRFCAEYSHQADTQSYRPEAGDTGASRPSSTSQPSSSASANQVVVPQNQVVSFQVIRPDHLVLTTSQPEKVIDFYEQIGFEVRTFGASDRKRRALFIHNFKINIHIIGQEIQPHAKHPSSGTLDICLVCKGTVDTTLKQLENHSIKPELGPVERTGAAGPITSVYIRDPDQNLIELAHYVSMTTASVENIGSNNQ